MEINLSTLLMNIFTTWTLSRYQSLDNILCSHSFSEKGQFLNPRIPQSHNSGSAKIERRGIRLYRNLNKITVECIRMDTGDGN